MNKSVPVVCVILAGGAGKRMGSKNRHKVCFPIAGRPAIVRAIDTYKRAGLRHFLVVVGQMADQVIATVSDAHPEVTFVHQAVPRGTGHAAAVAVEALAAQGYQGAAMIVMGDKVTWPHTVRGVLDQYAAGDADMILSTVAKDAASTSGRVLKDSRGGVQGIVEVADIRRAQQTGHRITVAGRQYAAADIERRCRTVNVSLYMFRFSSLREAVSNLRSDNAQGEFYLTDSAEYLAGRGRVEENVVADPSDLMGFNTPAELLAIEQVVRAREKPPRVKMVPRRRIPPSRLRSATAWLAELADPSAKFTAQFRRIYGGDESLIDERRKAIAQLVREFLRRFGSQKELILVRAPGRVNLMGRHVDHRGGFVNVMAISREVLLAASPREDDTVTLANLDAERFPSREFRISDLLREASWAEWMDFVDSRAVHRVLESARGDWGHYARAPLLRLQHECRQQRLRGMDCLVCGNIPMGAGLSSSSAMVVAFAESAVAINALDVTLRDFVDLCGEGEWFVGSRGGSSDHAAIRASHAGAVSRIGFFPFQMAGEVALPADLRVVIAHSGAQAVKSAGARDVFNHRVACYEFALMLLREKWRAASGVQHLRDLTPQRLAVQAGDIYRALARLPLRPRRAELRKLVPAAHRERAEQIFATHADIAPYDLRGVALFGISECVRSERFGDTVARGDLKAVGDFMRVSHNGDRVVRHNGDGKGLPFIVRTSDAALVDLAAAGAELSAQPGRYACSTEAIDRLVDSASAVPGVVGAQLAGAGLGGCMMILVHDHALEHLMKGLRHEFYQPRKIPFAAHVCTPVAGAGLLGA